MSRDDKRIGKNIRKIRNANKKDYYEFATDIGISEDLLKKIESVIKTLPMYYLYNSCKT